MSSSPEVQTWHRHASARVFTAVLMAGFAIGAIQGFVVLARAGEWLVACVAPLVFLLPASALWYWMWSPRTQAGPDGVTLRHGWTTTHLSWAEIGRCEAGYGGITITCLDGSEVLAPAPETTKFSAAAFGRRTKADKVAAYLELRAAYYREGIHLDDAA